MRRLVLAFACRTNHIVGNLMPRPISIYSYWDSSFDDELLENKVAMNLLYVQVRNSLSLFMVAQWLSGRVLD